MMKTRSIGSTVIILWLAFSLSGCTALVVGAAAGAGAGTAAAAREPRTTATTTKVGTVMVNVAYVPSKLLLAGGGAVLGAIAYLATIGDTKAAMRIWKPALGGTYVLTPSMVEGRQRVYFFGK